MFGLPRVDASSPVAIHTLCSAKQSEGRIHTQESTTTTEKISDVAECIICCDERITEQTPQLTHQTNQDCDLYKNKQVCHICIPKLELCPGCRENLRTGEMQNSLVDILDEMPQNNLQEQAQEDDGENLYPAQEQRYRCSHVHFAASGTLVVSLTTLGLLGWLAVTAIRDHTA